MKMKLFFYISSLILLTCFSACKRSAYPPVMQQAEALMETRPDSALYLLEGMADTLAMLPDEARMYYHLLIADENLNHQRKSQQMLKRDIFKQT